MFNCPMANIKNSPDLYFLWKMWVRIHISIPFYFSSADSRIEVKVFWVVMPCSVNIVL